MHINQSQKNRPRTVKWEQSIDDKAVEIAKIGCFKGGVSELLARLIVAESRRKRGSAHRYPPTLDRNLTAANN